MSGGHAKSFHWPLLSDNGLLSDRPALKCALYIFKGEGPSEPPTSKSVSLLTSKRRTEVPTRNNTCNPGETGLKNVTHPDKCPLLVSIPGTSLDTRNISSTHRRPGKCLLGKVLPPVRPFQSCSFKQTLPVTSTDERCPLEAVSARRFHLRLTGHSALESPPDVSLPQRHPRSQGWSRPGTGAPTGTGCSSCLCHWSG